MLFVLGVAAIEVGADPSVGPGDAVPLEERHLPTVVNAPGTWSDDERVRWPVAAVGIASRTEEVGLVDEKESLAVFAVSAVDGSASWVRTPGFSLERWGFTGGFAVSPDGEWIGWVRPEPSRRRSSAGRVAGWSVMNTTTGRIRRLEVPGFPWVRGTMADLAFSGDSHHLLTSFETPDRPKASRSRGHQLVAWSVDDGTPTVIEEAGPYWLPNLGSAPTGVTWARGRRVFRVNPGADNRTTMTLPQAIITASWGPDDASFAYIGRPSETPRAPWRLYAGRTVAEARGNPVALPSGINVAQLLGWRDATHVVVGHYRDSVHVVDVVTGKVETVDLSGYGEQVNAPQLAGALWQQPLVTPLEPDGTTDPRRPWRWLSCAFLMLFGGLLLVLWRRHHLSRERPGPEADGEPRRTTPTDPLAPRVAQPQRGPVVNTAAPESRPLRPLATAATGLILVLVDLRVQGVDLIPDPVGWLIAAVALTSLQVVHRGFYVAGVAAWLAVVPSLPEWFGVDGPLIAISTGLALLVAQFAACTAVMDVCPRRKASASAIRWLTLGLSGALVLAIAAGAAAPSTGVIALAVGLADAAVTVWFLVLLYGVAGEGSPRAVSHQRV